MTIVPAGCPLLDLLGVSTSYEPACGEGGLPKDRYPAYHREKARTGVGLMLMRQRTRQP